MENKGKIQISLLDDHELIRHGMAARFSQESDFDVVGIYASGQEMMSGLRNNPSEVLIVDYELGPLEIDGINFIKALRRKFPLSKLLVVSSLANIATIRTLVHIGVCGFVAKAEGLNAVVDAVRIVADGGTYGEISATQSLPDAAASSVVDASSFGKNLKLTSREREVMRCWQAGMSVMDIAAKFSKSGKTISAQKLSAMGKFGVKNDSELFDFLQKNDDF